MNHNTILLFSVFLYLVGHDLSSRHDSNTNLAATRAIGVQCNKYHDYGDMISKLKTYEETYNVN